MDLRSLAKPLALAVILVGFFALNARFGFADMVQSTDAAAWLAAMLDENLALAIAVFFVATALCSSLLAVPGVVFAIVAGLVFGPLLGTLCCWLGACTGAVIAFVLGRYFLQNAVRGMVAKSPLLERWLFGSKSDNLLYVLMVTRLVPLFPFNIQNFAYGATGIGLGMYAVGTLVFMLPGTAVYTVAASSFTGGENSAAYLAAALVLAAVVCAVTVAVKRRFMDEPKQSRGAKQS